MPRKMLLEEILGYETPWLRHWFVQSVLCCILSSTVWSVLYICDCFGTADWGSEEHTASKTVRKHNTLTSFDVHRR